MQNGNSKAISRFVDSIIFLLFVYVYFLVTEKIVTEVFIAGPISYRGMMYEAGQIVACNIAFWLLRDVALDIASGREKKPPE